MSFTIDVDIIFYSERQKPFYFDFYQTVGISARFDSQSKAFNVVYYNCLTEPYYNSIIIISTV